MKQKRLFSFIAFLLWLTITSSAQTDSTNTNKAHLKISLNYNSGLNYYGRTDSLKSTGFFPLAELWFSPNFYVNAAPVFVHNKVQAMEYAGTVTTVGYLYNSKKWLTNLYVLKPFYKESSGLVQSALKAQTSASISFLNAFLNLNAGGDVKFSNKTDFGASAGVDHIIRIPVKGNGVFVIDPSVYVYAGTQQFSRTYLQKSKGLLFSRTEQVTENVQQFSILSYEASVPLIFSKGPIQILATPAYVVPKNLIKVSGRPDLSETGANMFYTTVGIKYTI